MYIRRVKKKDPKTGTTYFYHQLVESYRTHNGLRQRILLNLGRLDLEPEDLKILADRIEGILSFSEADIDRAKVLIVGKLIHPASEREITPYGVI